MIDWICLILSASFWILRASTKAFERSIVRSGSGISLKNFLRRSAANNVSCPPNSNSFPWSATFLIFSSSFLDTLILKIPSSSRSKMC